MHSIARPLGRVRVVGAVLRTRDDAMRDRLLEAAIRRAGPTPASGRGLDELVAAMGGRAVPQAQETAHTPRTLGVGEPSWDPAAAVPEQAASSAVVAAAPPSIALELLRRRAARRLQAAAEQRVLDELGERVCARLEMHSRVTLRNGNGMLERWAYARRMRAGPADDPLLPPPYSTAADVPDLVAELEAAGAPPDRAAAAAASLGSAAAEARLWIARQRRRAAEPRGVTIRPLQRDAPGSAGAAVARGEQWPFDGTPPPPPSSQYEVGCAGVKLVINAAHLLKLHELYCRTSGVRTPILGEAGAPFRSALFCLLLRYDTLGGDGFQASLSPRAFDVLRDHFGVKAECFASPLNTRCAAAEPRAADHPSRCAPPTHPLFPRPPPPLPSAQLRPLLLRFPRR